MDLWKKFGDLGVLGMTVAEEYGGANMATPRTWSRWKRSRAHRHRSACRTARTRTQCVNQIHRNGTEAQKQKYLPKLVSGEHIGALAMSEPNAA